MKQLLHEKIDKFLQLLLLFGVVLIALFFYLQTIDSKIKNYTTYQQQLEKMIGLEYRLENFFLRSYRYIDYDETTEVLEEFEKRILSLKQSRIKEEFGQAFYTQIETIESLYRTKLQLLEDFKSLNARVTNSLYYLYDLRRSMSNTKLLDSQRGGVVDSVFFTIGQILMELNYDKAKLQQALHLLQGYAKEDRRFDYFYQHSQQFLINITLVQSILEKHKKVALLRQLKVTAHQLSDSYEASREQQKLIALFFFGLAFFVLVLLIFSYQRVRRTTRELLAFRYAIEKSDNAIVITDTNRTIEYVNEAFEHSSGYSKQEVLGKHPRVLKSDLLGREFYQQMNQALNRGEKWQGELISRRKDGSLLYEKSSIVPIFVDDEMVKYIAIKLDVTEYKEQQQKLQQSATVYDTIADGILITNSQQEVLSLNPAYTQMFGYSESELKGRETNLLSSLNQEEAFVKRVWYILEQEGRWAGKIYSKSKEGKVLPIWLTLTLVKDEEGEIRNYIAIYSNLEDIIEMEEHAEFLAYHDSLTQLPNRAYFEREVVHIFERANRYESQVAVMLLDLDRFKVINDTLGHSIGDAMLVTLANRIRSVLPQEDLVARIGGDEFVVVLDLVEGEEGVEVIAKRLLGVIAEVMEIENYQLNTTASIGIAHYPDDGKDKDEVMKHADSAMYDAKRRGKNIYAYYTKQLSVDIQERLELEQALKYAIIREELFVYYQPQYNIKTNAISGAEALVRWDSPTLGRVSPELFIPVAEETGLIIDLGYFVFEQACRDYMLWRAEGIAIETIAINISAVQFRDSELFDNFTTTMKHIGIPPSHVEIEITERFIMEDSSDNIAIIEKFREIGCKISIDDFGTGYSSMSYMKSLPLDTIKIDKSFVDELPHSSHDAEVSKAIIALSKSLGYDVVAEGIENPSQEAFLREHGCDIGQGYYFAKPMDSGAFVTFAKAKQSKK